MDILILSTPDWRGGTPQWSHLSNHAQLTLSSAGIEYISNKNPSYDCCLRERSENGSLKSRYQNRFVFRRSMTSLPRPLITAFIMKRPKPFTWSSLIDGGNASSWRSTTTSTR